MSVWVCPDHGLYGGQVFCPACGKNGSFATFEPRVVDEAAPITQEQWDTLKQRGASMDKYLGDLGPPLDGC